MSHGPSLLEARDLAVRYAGQAAPALRDVNFTLAAGERLGIVGESGCGKTTLARALLRLVTPAAGQVLWRGADLAILSAEELRARRRFLQMIFQDPLASLNPRMRIEDIVGEPLDCAAAPPDRATRHARIVALLEAMGLSGAVLSRRPRTFSGGQAQRIAIARALICGPEVLLCDEPVASLDLNTRRQVLALLRAQSVERGLALLFISHDLPAVYSLCDRVLVLHQGRVVEQGAVREVFAAPREAYTRRLLASVLVTDPASARARRISAGQV